MMQFHLNGFKPGNPAVSDAVGATASPPAADGLPDQVDVLIVGCGPAGLTLAAQLAAFPDITTRIIEQKSGPLLLGQADGIACRTLEMLNAYGFADRVLKEAYWVNETAFWKPDEQQPATIVRQGRIRDTEEGLSEFPHVILSQARVHDFFLDTMRDSPSRLVPDYSRRLLGLEIEAGSTQPENTHPVTVAIARTAAGHEGTIERVRARYVVGCDGARSGVRKALGLALSGDSSNHAWGVMDVLAVTDFPDIRLKATVHSAAEGSVLIIPREGGYLVRLYVELGQLDEHERVASRQLTVDSLVATAQRVLRPYSFDVKEVAWWSVYEIGQRLCERFDDVPAAEADLRDPRVFIAGDACHTHSPKAGQGMNVSMQDAFNLGWKLAAVLRGQSGPALLRTYSDERHRIARELIEFDRRFARMFSARPKSPDNADPDGVDLVDFQSYFIRQGRFTAGTATRYGPSIVCGEPTHQHLARGFEIGMRFHSAPAIRLADGRPLQLGHTVKADGRWRLFLFAGRSDRGAGATGIGLLCDYLSTSTASPLVRCTPASADVDAVIDVRAVFQHDHRALELGAMPALLRPKKGRYGLHDHEKVFCADPRDGHDIYAMREIDRTRGCIVVVRPDQHVAQVLPIDGYAELTAFFDGVFSKSAAGPAPARRCST